ncbi:Wzz/FepE/Etk N-terminal domain-containing protein [Peptococcaceae bacterium]|nr:Wzz/FepE/Etk N-terminal domain-containing protein [Peptococcaceae bacterium]
MQGQELETIDLREILHILKKNKHILIIVPLVAMIVAAFISFFVLKPVYQSFAVLMVGRTYPGEHAPLIQYHNLLIADKLVQTYGEIARSRSVLEEVIELENLETTVEGLSEQIQVSALKNTQLIKIAVNDTDPEKAARIANRVADVLMVKVVEIMRVDNVKVIDRAIVPNTPIKPNKKLNIIIAGVLGLMVAVGLVFLKESLDRTIKTSDDVKKHLELPVLGNITKI